MWTPLGSLSASVPVSLHLYVPVSPSIPALGPQPPGSPGDPSLAQPVFRGGGGEFLVVPGQVWGAGEPPHLGTAQKGGSQARWEALESPGMRSDRGKRPRSSAGRSSAGQAQL